MPRNLVEKYEKMFSIGSIVNIYVEIVLFQKECESQSLDFEKQLYLCYLETGIKISSSKISKIVEANDELAAKIISTGIAEIDEKLFNYNYPDFCCTLEKYVKDKKAIKSSEAITNLRLIKIYNNIISNDSDSTRCYNDILSFFNKCESSSFSFQEKLKFCQLVNKSKISAFKIVKVLANNDELASKIIYSGVVNVDEKFFNINYPDCSLELYANNIRATFSINALKNLNLIELYNQITSTSSPYYSYEAVINFQMKCQSLLENFEEKLKFCFLETGRMIHPYIASLIIRQNDELAAKLIYAGVVDTKQGFYNTSFPNNFCLLEDYAKVNNALKSTKALKDLKLSYNSEHLLISGQENCNEIIGDNAVLEYIYEN